MNKLNKVMIAVLLAVSFSTANAVSIGGYDEVSSVKTFRSGPTISQEAAYQLGLSMLKSLSIKSSSQLSRLIPGSILEGSTYINGSGNVRVTKRLIISGLEEYTAMVSVPLTYQLADSDR